MSTRPPASSLPQLHDVNGVFVRLIDKAYNAHIQEALLDANGGQEVLDFNLPWGNDRIPIIKNEMQITFGGSVFRVRTPQSAFDQQGALSYTVHCEALWYDLQASDPRPAINVTTPIAAMNAAVSGTGWTVGTVGPSANATFQVTVGASALAVLRAIPAVFGGELQFDNVNKVVHLLNARGQQTGLLYARGKNATQDIVNIDTTNMYTRVYPTGQNGIDISTVNTGAKKYIEDYTYYDSISAPHIIRAVAIQNTALTTPAQVLAWGQGQLNVMRLPATTYQFAITVLKGDTLPNLGDTVKVWDKVLNYQTSARIVARDTYPLEPTKSTLTINTALASLTSDLATTPAPTAQVTTTTTSDTLAPANPTGVVLNANYSFTGQGTRQITVSASWNAVTTNSDGSPITDLDHYEVQYQTDSSGMWISMGNTTDVSLMSPVLAVQSTVIARVAAVDHAGNRSAWVQTTGPVTADTAPPVQPAPLTLASGNFPLTIEASWNGQTINNHPMAQDSPDFAFLEVHMSATAGFTPSATTLVDTIVGAVGGTAVAPGLTPGVTYYFTSVAVDRAGNRSPQSTQVSGTTGALPSNYIGSVSISTLVAGSAALGTLHADVTMAARIKTADTGARVEMNASGIFAYDAGGNNTVAIHNDGSASFTGVFNVSAGSTVPTSVLTGLDIGGGNLWTRSRPSGLPEPMTTQGGAVMDIAGTFETINPCWHVTISSVASSTDWYKGLIHGDRIKVQPGITYTLTTWFYLGSLTTSPLNISARLTTCDSTNAYIGEVHAQVNLTGPGWTRATATFTAPSNCDNVQFSTQFPYQLAQVCNYYVYGIQLEQGKVATSYHPSVIEASQNLIGGGQAYGLTSINGRLTVGAETGAHVTVGSGDGKGTNGLRMFDVDGNTVLIDMSLGATPTITAAAFQTAASGVRVAMGTSVTSGRVVDTILFYSGDAAEARDAGLAPYGMGTLGVGTTSATAANRQGVVAIKAPQLQPSSQTVAFLRILSGAADGSTGGWVEASGGEFRLSTSPQTNMRLQDNTIYLRGSTDNNHFLQWNATVPDGPTLAGYNGVKFATMNGGLNFRVYITAGAVAPFTDGQIAMGGTANRWANVFSTDTYWFPHTGTATSSGTVCKRSTDSYLMVASSLRANKTRFKPHKLDRAHQIIDALHDKVQTFRFKADIEKGFDFPELTEVGMVAEDLHDAGLTELVQYEIPWEITEHSSEKNGHMAKTAPTGEPARPTGIHYDRLGAVLLPVVKELLDRVEALEGRKR